MEMTKPSSLETFVHFVYLNILKSKINFLQIAVNGGQKNVLYIKGKPVNSSRPVDETVLSINSVLIQISQDFLPLCHFASSKCVLSCFKYV